MDTLTKEAIMLQVTPPVAISPGMRQFHTQYCSNTTYMSTGFLEQPEASTRSKVGQLIAIEEERDVPNVSVLCRLATRYFRLAGNEVKASYEPEVKEPTSSWLS